MSIRDINNKEAWEYKVYEWRTQFQGNPKEVAEGIIKKPREFLQFHSEYFRDIDNENIASICGSDGRRALALAALGATPTVFDISEPQKKYALEMANSVGLHIEYELGDFNFVDVTKYFNYFDMLYCEGGILHYFHDIDLFFQNCHSIIKKNGEFVLSDFHPFRKGIYVKEQKRNVEKAKGNYFDTEIHEGHVPYAKYFSEEIQKQFPTCKFRFYTLSEIINGAIRNGFEIKRFDEHPKYNDSNVPGEFTLLLKSY